MNRSLCKKQIILPENQILLHQINVINKIKSISYVSIIIKSNLFDNFPLNHHFLTHKFIFVCRGKKFNIKFIILLTFVTLIQSVCVCVLCNFSATLARNVCINKSLHFILCEGKCNKMLYIYNCGKPNIFM